MEYHIVFNKYLLISNKDEAVGLGFQFGWWCDIWLWMIILYQIQLDKTYYLDL